MIGKEFGRWKVIGVDYSKKGNVFCQCSCDKHTIKSVSSYSLQIGESKSCGCLHKEIIKETNRKHTVFDIEGENGIGYTTNKGNPFLFDIEDYNLIKDYCCGEDNDGYVYIVKQREGKKTCRQGLHNFLMQCPDGKVVDHINGNIKDNRKVNLRITDAKGNSRNHNTNKPPGIRKVYNKWYVRVSTREKEYYCGSFNSYEEAVFARYLAQDIIYGEYSSNNNRLRAMVDSTVALYITNLVKKKLKEQGVIIYE